MSKNTDIERGLSDLLSAYSLGRYNLREYAEWISSIDWERIDLDSKLAQTLGELDVLCTEIREGIRPESDFKRKVSECLLFLNP
jgi:hypothetical protein